jgi:SAM-dependent methyltransferase
MTDGGFRDPARIWAHYQSSEYDVFEGATARLDYLVREVDRRAADPRPRILTIGVGDGYLERAIAARGWDVVAVDPDQSTCDRLLGVGVDARCGVIEALPVPDTHFDFVLASEVVEHLTVTQGERALDEIVRVLQPGGWFVGTVPYDENLLANHVVCPECGAEFHRWGHQRTFTSKSLREHLGTRLVDIEVRLRAFVNFRGRSLRGKVKSGLRWMLGFLGEGVAVPGLFFAGRRP